jgi:hypothetical protein
MKGKLIAVGANELLGGGYDAINNNTYTPIS